MNPRNSNENENIDELDIELEVRRQMEEYYAPGMSWNYNFWDVQFKARDILMPWDSNNQLCLSKWAPRETLDPVQVQTFGLKIEND